MKRQTFVEIISLLFILLFVYAATSKLIDHQKFRVQMGQSPMLTSYAGIVSWAIPILEIVISIMLAIPKYRLPGLYAGFSLMLMFTTYIIVISNFSDYVPCSCGGILQNMNWNQHLIFNIFFVAISSIAILLHPKEVQHQQIITGVRYV